jgi:hypothetical protein
VAKTTWKIKLLICAVVITLVGLIPWEGWFSIEIRNSNLQNLAGGELAFGGIFLFVCIGFPMILNRTKGFAQGFLFLLFPFVLMVSGLIWFISFFLPSPKWSDEYVYQNDNDYVILQVQEAGFMDVDSDWRIIRTASPMSVIRRIEDSQLIKREDNIYNSSKTEITFANKTWHKVSLPKD